MISTNSQVGTYPRYVTPGIENQNSIIRLPEQGLWCRPDWMRFVGPEDQRHKLIELLEEWFGESTRSNFGATYFRHGLQWESGVLYSQGHPSNIIMVDLQGKQLATMCPIEALRLAGEIITLGFRCTRIDLAVDHVLQNVNLYDKALASCEANELCIMRRFAPDPEFTSQGVPLRKLLKLGKRDSEVCARIYDKGLEMKIMLEGQWERFEVEIKKERAQVICLALVKAGEKYNELLWEYVIGSVDFRINNGRSELDRRPRCKWWEDYIRNSTPQRITPIPSESGLDQWCAWLRRSALPRVLQLASIQGKDPIELIQELLVGVEPARTETQATVDARIRVQDSI